MNIKTVENNCDMYLFFYKRIFICIIYMDVLLLLFKVVGFVFCGVMIRNLWLIYNTMLDTDFIVHSVH